MCDYYAFHWAQIYAGMIDMKNKEGMKNKEYMKNN